MASEESPIAASEESQKNEPEFKEPSLNEIEKIEEEKLKAKFSSRPVHSAFLQKRLAKGQKYFDSGDYQMAKQKGPKILSTNTSAASANVPPASLAHPTGDAIPTPETVPMRKTSIVQSKLAVSPAGPTV
nr:EOG090X0P2R [Ilyocryptus agilis]